MLLLVELSAVFWAWCWAKPSSTLTAADAAAEAGARLVVLVQQAAATLPGCRVVLVRDPAGPSWRVPLLNDKQRRERERKRAAGERPAEGRAAIDVAVAEMVAAGAVVVDPPAVDGGYADVRDVIAAWCREVVEDVSQLGDPGGFSRSARGSGGAAASGEVVADGAAVAVGRTPARVDVGLRAVQAGDRSGRGGGQRQALAALVSDRVTLLRQHGSDLAAWGPAQVRENVGVAPERVADLLALADLPGVSRDSARRLMQRHGSAEAVLAEAARTTDGRAPWPGLRAARGEMMQRALMVARLRDDVVVSGEVVGDGDRVQDDVRRVRGGETQAEHEGGDGLAERLHSRPRLDRRVLQDVPRGGAPEGVGGDRGGGEAGDRGAAAARPVPRPIVADVERDQTATVTPFICANCARGFCGGPHGDHCKAANLCQCNHGREPEPREAAKERETMTREPTHEIEARYADEEEAPREPAPLAVRQEAAPVARAEPRPLPPAMQQQPTPPPGPRWQSEEVDELFRALALAQEEFGAVAKTRTAKIRAGYEYNYANLSDVYNAVAPALRKHGLVPSQIPRGNVVVTRLQHGPSGQWIAGALPLVLPDHGADIQRLGSAITYLRRYALCMMVGVVAVDDDDDGNSAQPTRGRAA
ncbi:MAG TPA: ERF family protein [Anaeromyxobacteraceae bacterium]|nr:ERF family protein [Anaeromyxobacteraceae bacterium]